MPQNAENSQTPSSPGLSKHRDRQVDFQMLAKEAEAREDWKAAASFYAQAVEQRSTELSLVNNVQEGLSSKLEMQAIYDLVGDSLRDTFNAQVVMISQYDPHTNRIFHHYAIERGEHIRISGWHPIDSSRLHIARTGKPFLIHKEEILKLLEAEKMQVIPGTEVPKTWLGVPMLVGSEVKGIVSLQNLDRDYAFTASDIDLLTTLTNSMTLSLENARLFNETEALLKRIEQEMAIARKTQQSILPTQLPSHEAYDFGALIHPAHAVGGDFYDFIQRGSHKLCIVIGDVSDKGLPAALVMALIFSLIRVETKHTRSSLQVLQSVNRHMLHMNATNMYATLIYSILDYELNSLTYSRAGHLLPILIDKDGCPIEIPMHTGQSLGIFNSPLIDDQQIWLPPGSVLLFYSDGLTEPSNESGVEFGVERVKQVLVSHRHENAQSICEQLWLAVQSHSGDRLYQDDFTTLIIKRK